MTASAEPVPGALRAAHVVLAAASGDRQSALVAALGRLRAAGTVEAVSGFYAAVHAGAGRPERAPALVVAATVRSDRASATLAAAARGASRDAHAVEVLALVDAGDGAGAGLAALAPEALAALAEIAPALTAPGGGAAVAELAAAGAARAVRLARTTAFVANRQEGEPDVRLSIARAGVRGVRRIVRLRVAGRETPFNAEFAMTADLAPDRAGVHMSRFSELLETAVRDALERDGGGRLEEIVDAVAARVVGSQRALRAEVTLRARFALERWSPVSGAHGEESYVLTAIANADARGVRRAIGVEAEGMTACPCAQLMIRERSLHDLREAGFSEADAARALDALPVATHNQRGRGTLVLGLPAGSPSPEIADLVAIVERAMSSETYELLKRPDEHFVVSKAHHNPRFVEDVVRGIAGGALEAFAHLDDGAFVLASQVNDESIHKHDAIAETWGTFGELRAELRDGVAAGGRTRLADWLEGDRA